MLDVILLAALKVWALRLTISLASALPMILIPSVALLVSARADARQLSNVIDTSAATAANATVIVLSGKDQCLGTAIGARTIITTSYCVKDAAFFGVPTDTTPKNPIKCQTTSSAREWGVSVCTSEADIPVPSYALVDTSYSQLSAGVDVVVVGGSCGIATIANLRIVQTRLAAGRPQEGLEQLLLENTAMCAGDAGGGVFIRVGDGSLRMVGVLNRSIGGIAFAANISSIAALNWLKGAQTQTAPICGLGASAPSCAVGQPGSAIATVTTASSTLAVDGIISNVRYYDGESLEAVVNRVCGQQQAEYYDLLSSYYRSKHQSTMPRDRRFQGWGMIDLIACRNSQSSSGFTRRRAARGDSIWKYFKENADSAAWKTFESEGATDVSSLSFQEAVQALNPSIVNGKPIVGSEVRIPRVPVRAAESRRASSGKGIQGLVALQNDEVTDGQCPQNYTDEYPFNIQTILDILSDNFHRNALPGSATILIADSGLHLSSYGGLDPQILDIGAIQKQTEYIKSIAPLQNGTKTAHGTQVTSVALGGPILSKVAALGGFSRIKVRALRIYKERDAEMPDGSVQRFVDVDENAFSAIIKEAQTTRVAIVNLSIKSDIEISSLKDALGKGSGALYIVAAGNDGLYLDMQSRTYPAMYGGPMQSEMLTVGAINGAGEWAEGLSNFNPTFVEIAAPGCDISAFDYSDGKFSVGRFSGTSMSAPLVSFTAALIKSEVKEWRAPEIKRRILVASDINRNMTDKVKDGRVLNVGRAISVYRDTVSKTRGTIAFGLATLFRGGLSVEESSLKLECLDVQRELYGKELVKIVPDFRSLGGQEYALIDFRPSGSDDVKTAVCRIPDGLEVAFDNVQSGKRETFPLSSIYDFTRRDI